MPHFAKGSGSFTFLFYNLLVLFVNCCPSVDYPPIQGINVKFMLRFEKKTLKGQKREIFYILSRKTN